MHERVVQGLVVRLHDATSQAGQSSYWANRWLLLLCLHDRAHSIFEVAPSRNSWSSLLERAHLLTAPSCDALELLARPIWRSYVARDACWRESPIGLAQTLVWLHPYHRRDRTNSRA